MSLSLARESLGDEWDGERLEYLGDIGRGRYSAQNPLAGLAAIILLGGVVPPLWDNGYVLGFGHLDWAPPGCSVPLVYASAAFLQVVAVQYCQRLGLHMRGFRDWQETGDFYVDNVVRPEARRAQADSSPAPVRRGLIDQANLGERGDSPPLVGDYMSEVSDLHERRSPEGYASGSEPGPPA